MSSTPCMASQRLEELSCSSSWSDSTTCSAATDTAMAIVMSWQTTLPRARLECVDGGDDYGDVDVCPYFVFSLLYYNKGMFYASYNIAFRLYNGRAWESEQT